MRQDLIDLLLGELEPNEAEALKARIVAEPQLARELKELESLFGLMRRGEEIEPTPAMRATVLAAAARVRPSLWHRLRQLPDLVRYRFANSRGFRFATISLCAHLVLMAVLFDVLFVHGKRDAGDEIRVNVVQDDADLVQQPSRRFTLRLLQRRLPQETRVRQYGVDGQAEAIRAGIDQLVASQADDGSFGDLGATGYGALALLAEGDSSVQSTKRGRTIRAAVDHLLGRVERGEAHGAALAALVEDYTLSYESLRAEQRVRYAHAIRSLILEAGDDAAWQEGLALARLAGFALPAGRELGDADYLVQGTNPLRLLDEPATRLRATVVLARGQLVADRVKVREWAGGLFAEAVRSVDSQKTTGVVLLTLQAPYRL